MVTGAHVQVRARCPANHLALERQGERRDCGIGQNLGEAVHLGAGRAGARDGRRRLAPEALASLSCL